MSIYSGLLGVQAQKRRVFFSFHYQNDIWRVNQVRNSWRHRHESQREAEGFFDGSIWENSKRTSDDSLKNLIRDGIQNTSVTCVLVGENTFSRRWVRYEIARSILKGNGILSVRVHNLKNQMGYASNEGPNPFDCMGTYKTDDGRLLLAEKNNGKWVRYLDYTQQVYLPAQWQKPTSTSVIPLSRYAYDYCYYMNNGAANFSSWVRDAATNAGR